MSTSTPPKTKAPTLATRAGAAVPAGIQSVADTIANQRKAMTQVNRQVANATWSDKSLTPAEREKYTDLCRSIGLNAALGHAQILGGNFYVTHKGLLHLLNADGRMWRIEGSPVVPGEPDFEFWAEDHDPAQVRIWRTSIKLWRPEQPDQVIEYTDFGVALLSAFGKDKKVTAPQMAKKRAEHRAIRAVLCIDIPSADELYEEQFVQTSATVVAPVTENLLGDIPLEPPPWPPAAETKQEPKPEPKAEAPLHQQVLQLAQEGDIKLEALFAAASKIAGKQVASTRDLEALPVEALSVLLDQLEGSSGE